MAAACFIASLCTPTSALVGVCSPLYADVLSDMRVWLLLVLAQDGGTAEVLRAVLLHAGLSESLVASALARMAVHPKLPKLPWGEAANSRAPQLSCEQVPGTTPVSVSCLCSLHLVRRIVTAVAISNYCEPVRVPTPRASPRSCVCVGCCNVPIACGTHHKSGYVTLASCGLSESQTQGGVSRRRSRECLSRKNVRCTDLAVRCARWPAPARVIAWGRPAGR